MWACPDCHGPTRPPRVKQDGRCPKCRKKARASALALRRARKARAAEARLIEVGSRGR